MQYKIDYMKELELKSTLNLVKNVFDEFNSSDYEEEGIENFYNFIEEDSIKNKIESGSMIVLVARTSYNQIIGTIAVSADNHVNLLFIDKEFQRKGIGTNLLKFAINICKYNDENISKITVNSSPYAVEFYHKYGFKDYVEGCKCLLKEFVADMPDARSFYTDVFCDENARINELYDMMFRERFFYSTYKPFNNLNFKKHSIIKGYIATAALLSAGGIGYKVYQKIKNKNKNNIKNKEVEKLENNIINGKN